MNKKVSLILAIFIAFVGILLVSVLGLLPEDLRDNVKMQELFFDITPNNKGAKVLEKNFKANDNTVDLYSITIYAPLETTNIIVRYSTDQPLDKVAVSSTGILTIYDLKLSAFNVFVESTDGSNLKDKLTIKKPKRKILRRFCAFQPIPAPYQK